MPSSGDLVKRVAFQVVVDPEQWTIGDEPAYLVVTQKNLSAYYSSPPAGSDFTDYIYLVVCLGWKPNPGYGVSVLRIEQLKDTVTIRVELKEPEPGKMYAQVLVRPVTVAGVARANLEPGGMLDFVFIDQKGQQLAKLKVEV